MARRPVTGLLSQYAKNAGGASASGYWLKFFSAAYGATTSPLTMYTRQSGGVGLSKCKLNTRGEPISDSGDNNSTFIPYIDGDWDAYIFFTEADADANNTVNSIYLGTNIQPDPDFSTRAIVQFADLDGLIDGEAVDGSSINYNVLTNNGAWNPKVSTVVNNTTSKKGGAEYIIKTAAQVSADGDVIDGYVNHWLLGGASYAGILVHDNYINPWQAGALPTDGSASIQAILTGGFKLDGNGDEFIGNNLTFSGSLYAKNISIKSNDGGTILRNNRTPRMAGSISQDFIAGDNDMPEISGVVVGESILLKTTTVRYADVDGDYTFGQLVRVYQITGGVMSFTPAIAEDFTATTYEVYEDYTVKMDKVTFNAADNTNNSSLFVADFVNDVVVNDLTLIGGGTQNVGAIFTGVGISINDPKMQNFKNTSLGYILGVNGSNISIKNPVGARGRHLIEGNTDRTYFTLGLVVDGGAISKSADASLFTYVVGAHCNAINPIYRNIKIDGPGYLIAIRGGSGVIDNCELTMESNSNYAPVLITERGADCVDVINNKFFGGLGYCMYLSCNEAMDGITFDNNTIKGDKVICRIAPSQITNNLKITNNKGECRQFFDSDMGGATLTNLKIHENSLNSTGTFSSVYSMHFNNLAACTGLSIKNNNIDDSQNTGLITFGSITGDLSFDITSNENLQTFRFIEINNPTIGDVSYGVIHMNKSLGKCNLSFAGGQTFSDVIDYSHNKIADYSSASTAPISHSCNIFNVGTDVILNSTYEPLSGNANIGAGGLKYSGLNVAFDGTLS